MSINLSTSFNITVIINEHMYSPLQEEKSGRKVGEQLKLKYFGNSFMILVNSGKKLPQGKKSILTILLKIQSCGKVPVLPARPVNFGHDRQNFINCRSN